MPKNASSHLSQRNVTSAKVLPTWLPTALPKCSNHPVLRESLPTSGRTKICTAHPFFPKPGNDAGKSVGATGSLGLQGIKSAKMGGAMSSFCLQVLLGQAPDKGAAAFETLKNLAQGGMVRKSRQNCYVGPQPVFWFRGGL